MRYPGMPNLDAACSSLATDIEMDDLDLANTIATPEPMDLDADGQDPDSDPEPPLEEASDVTIHIPDTGAAPSTLLINSDESDNSDSDSDSDNDRGETLHSSGTDPEHGGQAGMFFYMSETPTLMTNY